MKKIECPCCGATLTIDENNEYGVCEFCGSKVRLDDYRSTNVLVDEANIRKVESEKEIRMKELEMQQSQQEETRKHQKKMTYIGVGLLVVILAYAAIRNIFFDDFFTTAVIFTMGMPVMVIGAFFFFFLPKRMGRTMSTVVENGISYPSGAIGNFQRKDYREVAGILNQAGFTNVLCVNAHDSLFPSYRVRDILVDGHFVTAFGNNVFPADVPILVRYHG